MIHYFHVMAARMRQAQCGRGPLALVHSHGTGYFSVGVNPVTNVLEFKPSHGNAVVQKKRPTARGHTAPGLQTPMPKLSRDIDN